MKFKSYKEGELYCYMGIVPPPVTAPPGSKPGGGTEGGPSKPGDRLRRYLGWAADLSGGKNLWAIIRESPESLKRLGELQPARISWKYDLVANDTEGMGIDKGFVPVQSPFSPLHSDQGQASLLLRLPDLRLLLELSEDALGDVNSHVTLFALGNADTPLPDLLTGDGVPQVGSILGAGDLLIHMSVGKERGFYDTFLVKARSGMEEAVQSLPG